MADNINDKQAAQDWQSKKSQYPNLDGEHKGPTLGLDERLSLTSVPTYDCLPCRFDTAVLIQPGDYLLARLPSSSPIPSRVLDVLSKPVHEGANPFFCTVSRTQSELSVLVSTSTGLTKEDIETDVGISSDGEDSSREGYGLDGPWRAFRIRGPMEFHLVGVLLEFSKCLAQRSISIFAVSTWDTDYICVKEADFAGACEALKEDGWNVLDHPQ